MTRWDLYAIFKFKMAQQIETEVQEETIAQTTPTRIVKTTKVVTPPIVSEHPQKAYEKKKAIFRTYQVIWYILGIIEVLLGFRVVLRMLGANPQAGFANLIYSLSSPLTLPFSGILPTTAGENSVLEWSTFVAMIVYVLLAYGLVELLQFIKPTNPQEVEENVSS